MAATRAVLKKQLKKILHVSARVRTPSFESFGAMSVDVHVDISGEGWTVNKVGFSFFANTCPGFCLAYGPGLLPTTVCGVEMPFLIQAKDTCNNKRQSGGDYFQVWFELSESRRG